VREALQQLLDDACGRSPHEALLDHVGVGFKSDAAAFKPRARLAVAHGAQWELEHRVHLAR